MKIKINSKYSITSFKLNYRCEENPPGSGNFKCDINAQSDSELNKQNKLKLSDIKYKIKSIENENKSLKNQLKEHKHGSLSWKEIHSKIKYSELENLKKQERILLYKHPESKLEFVPLIQQTDEIIKNLPEHERDLLTGFVFGAGNISYQNMLQYGKGNIPTPEEYAKAMILQDANAYSNKKLPNENDIYSHYLKTAESSILAINTMDNIINKSSINVPITVYSGISSRIYDKIGAVGSEFLIPQFLSTSRNEKVANGFAEIKWHDKQDYPTVLEIHIKPGSKGLGLENFALESEGPDAEWIVGNTGKKGVGSQAEILLGRNLKCIVKNIQNEPHKSRRIIVEAYN